MKTVYKVFMIYEGKLWSYNIPPGNPYFKDGQLSLQYHKGRLKRPKFGKIFAFADLAIAKKFLYEYAVGYEKCDFNFKVWECQTSRWEMGYRIMASRDNIEGYKDAWGNGDRLYPFMTPGTIFCDAIKPIKEI